MLVEGDEQLASLVGPTPNQAGSGTVVASSPATGASSALIARTLWILSTFASAMIVFGDWL